MLKLVGAVVVYGLALYGFCTAVSNNIATRRRYNAVLNKVAV